MYEDGRRETNAMFMIEDIVPDGLDVVVLASPDMHIDDEEAFGVPVLRNAEMGVGQLWVINKRRLTQVRGRKSEHDRKYPRKKLSEQPMPVGMLSLSRAALKFKINRNTLDAAVIRGDLHVAGTLRGASKPTKLLFEDDVKLWMKTKWRGRYNANKNQARLHTQRVLEDDRTFSEEREGHAEGSGDRDEGCRSAQKEPGDALGAEGETSHAMGVDARCECARTDES